MTSILTGSGVRILVCDLREYPIRLLVLDNGRRVTCTEHHVLDDVLTGSETSGAALRLITSSPSSFIPEGEGIRSTESDI